MGKWNRVVTFMSESKTVWSDQAARKTRLVTTIMDIKYVGRGGKKKKHQTLKICECMGLKMMKYLVSLPMSLHSFTHISSEGW